MNSFGFSWDTPTQGAFFVGLLLWEIIWKGFALWRAGRKNQPAWFFLLFVLNTAGILPIVYLFISRDKTKKIISSKKKR